MKLRFWILILLLAPNISLSETFITSEAIQPIPARTVLLPMDVKKANLGFKLFQDKRLSKTNTISCMSCHDIYNGGADGRKGSVGINGQIGDANSPTVMNSSLNFRQFWDGRALSLEDQVDGPVHNPVEMGSSWEEIKVKLSKDKSYQALFKEVYEDGLTKKNIKDAIVFFEKTLTTPDSRFDQYLRGDSSAITMDEKLGYEKFKSFGCISCHQGMNVGGNMFQSMGVAEDFFKGRMHLKKSDLGLYNVTGNPEDKHVFRVPSLRNVTLTAPYFHDGSAETLEEAIRVMAKFQLGRSISTPDVEYISKFLHSIRGKQPTKQDRE